MSSDQFWFGLLVCVLPLAYALYLGTLESAISGWIALWHKRKRDRESEANARRAWQAKNRRQAVKLEEWRQARSEERALP